jgi:hypothetical protein
VSPPRLVATDLDGTAVRSDGTFSPRTVAAFARVVRAGAELVIVTGRPPRLMAGVAEAVGHRGVAVCANGAFFYDLATGRVEREVTIEPATLAEAARRLREAIPGIGLAVEFAEELAADPHYERWEWDAGATVHRLADAELLARPAPKLLGRHPTLSADELLALARPVLEDLVFVYHSNGSRLVEAVATGVSKAAALADLAARHGIDAADTVAFGDMPNDLPMLAWAGTSYAMADAHPEVLAAADHVIATNDEDGVAQVLEQLFSAEAGGP